MFNLIKSATSQLSTLNTCQLCGVDAQAMHSICQDCWNNLPWYKQNIQRQEMDISVACYYAYPIDRIIQKFKYEQQLHYQTEPYRVCRRVFYLVVFQKVCCP